MDKPTPPPALFQVISADIRLQQYFGLACFLLVFGIMLTFFSTYVAIGVLTLLGAGLFGILTTWRVRHFRAILDNPIETSGQIQAISRSLFTRRGRFLYTITYSYTCLEQDYRGICRIAIPDDRLPLQAEDSVTVLAWRENPRYALIPALYTQ